MQTDHIAFLVKSIKAVSDSLPVSCTRHEIEEQPSEGTLEQYITFGNDKYPSVLLMQAVTDGPYMRAMKKRGPGVHHIGCVCTNIEEEIFSGRTKNLLLHPISIKTHKRGTVWLCKPGLPFMIELHQNPGQASILRDKAILQLPGEIILPDYACELAANLTVENTTEKTFFIKIGETKIALDPHLV